MSADTSRVGVGGLPELNRPPSIEELNLLLEACTREPQESACPNKPSMALPMAEYLIKDDRFSAIVMGGVVEMTLVLLRGDATGVFTNMAVAIQSGLVFGARLGMLMRDNDREKEEVDRVLKGMEDKEEGDSYGGI